MVHDAATAWVARLTACTSPSGAGQTVRQRPLRQLNRSVGLTSHCPGASPLSGAETPRAISVADSREIVRTGSGARSGAGHSQGYGTDVSATGHQVRCRRRSDRDVVGVTCFYGSVSDCGAGGWVGVASADAAAMRLTGSLEEPIGKCDPKNRRDESCQNG